MQLRHCTMFSCALMVMGYANGENKVMYVVRDKTKVFAAKSLRSEVITELASGNPVQVLATENVLFLRITTPDGKIGFVPYTSLSDRQDSQGRRLAGYLRRMVKPSDEALDATFKGQAATVMGARGLTYSTNPRLDEVMGQHPDFKAVLTMEGDVASVEDVAKLAEHVADEISRLGATQQGGVTK